MSSFSFLNHRLRPSSPITHDAELLLLHVDQPKREQPLQDELVAQWLHQHVSPQSLVPPQQHATPDTNNPSNTRQCISLVWPPSDSRQEPPIGSLDALEHLARHQLVFAHDPTSTPAVSPTDDASAQSLFLPFGAVTFSSHPAGFTAIAQETVQQENAAVPAKQ
jgi:hypothetical protein